MKGMDKWKATRKNHCGHFLRESQSLLLLQLKRHDRCNNVSGFVRFFSRTVIKLNLLGIGYPYEADLEIRNYE